MRQLIGGNIDQMKLEVDKDEIFNDELVDEYFADDSGSFYYHPSLTLPLSFTLSRSLCLSWYLSHKIIFVNSQHKNTNFKRCFFCTQKLVLNIRFKDLWCLKINMRQKHILKAISSLQDSYY